MQHFYSLRRVCGGALLTALLGAGLSAAAQTSLAFNGTNSYAPTTLTSVTGANVSLECWVKPTAFKTGSPGISGLIGMESGYDAAMLRLGDDGIASNKVQLVLAIQGDHQKLTSATALTAGTWYHLAGTYDGTTMRLYINGVLDASGVITGTVTGTGAFTIGRDYDNTRILSGLLDEARVWTRTLTAAEIAANACAIASPTTATGLAGYWRFNEGSGTSSADASGKNHPATLTNGPAWSTDIPASCASALAVRTGSATGGLQAQVLGNPAPGTAAELEISGAQGQPVRVQLLSPIGAVVAEQVLPGAATRATLPLPGTPGLYLVRVSTPGRTTTTRLLKQ